MRRFTGATSERKLYEAANSEENFCRGYGNRFNQLLHFLCDAWWSGTGRRNSSTHHRFGGAKSDCQSADNRHQQSQ